jgi:hypothetical protein
MSNVGYDSWFKKQVSTVFVVKNITLGFPQEKTVRVFQAPIKAGATRDLLALPHVSEADIRHGLLKGELMIKLKNRELAVVASNIDLLQFDSEQLAFLESVGVVDGLQVSGGGTLNFAFKQNINLIGTKNGSNRKFTVPAPDKFINGSLGANEFRILVRHNGKGLLPGIDYTMSESGGAGTGLDTIQLITFKPIADSTLVADYVVKV